MNIFINGWFFRIVAQYILFVQSNGCYVPYTYVQDIVMYCRRVVMHRTLSTRYCYVQEKGGYVPYTVVQDMKNGYAEWKEFTRYYKVIYLEYLEYLYLIIIPSFKNDYRFLSYHKILILRI